MGAEMIFFEFKIRTIMSYHYPYNGVFLYIKKDIGQKTNEIVLHLFSFSKISSLNVQKIKLMLPELYISIIPHISN